MRRPNGSFRPKADTGDEDMTLDHVPPASKEAGGLTPAPFSQFRRSDGFEVKRTRLVIAVGANLV